MSGGDACLLDSNILLRISKSDDAQHGVIPIQTLAREGFIREQGNLVRELRKLLKRGVKLALAELLHSAGNTGRFFKQACGIGADVNALGRRLSAQFRLNLGLDLNNDRHRRRLSLYLIVLRPAVYRRHPSRSREDVSRANGARSFNVTGISKYKVHRFDPIGLLT